MPHILLIEDDESLAKWVEDYLTARHFTVSLCYRGDEALDMAAKINPDLILLDGMLPGLDGMDVCRQIRIRDATPIIMLTARDEEIDEVLGLEVGADDYLTKPVKPRILLARINATLRRHASLPIEPNIVQIGGLRLTPSDQSVTLDEKPISLTSKEFELLLALAERAGTIISRAMLVGQLRGIEYDGFDRSIDQRISRLRKKLGDDPANPKRIKTVWNKGYMLAKDAW